MSQYYQNFPEKLDPVAFSIGFFQLRWYAVFFLLSFFFAFAVVSWRVYKNEDRHIFAKANIGKRLDFFLDLFLVGFFGIIVGGRMGFVLFYDIGLLFENPLAIISPFDGSTGRYEGIFGMSYFGAFIGAATSCLIFLKKRSVDFWKVADFVIPAVAISYFFGRIGNFVNGELYGRKTDFFLGMRFLGEKVLRHPSQLYEAFFEGLLVFAILWPIRNKAVFDGQILLLYAISYSFFRFFMEYLREPGIGEAVLGGIMTKGQIFSIILFSLSVIGYFQKKARSGIIKKG